MLAVDSEWMLVVALVKQNAALVKQNAALVKQNAMVPCYNAKVVTRLIKV
jgi:hypothetical protein